MNLMNYFFEANSGLALITAIYYLLLRNETAFAFMRTYLLTGIVASLLFPLIHSSFPFFNSNPIPVLSNWMTITTMPELIFGTTDTTSVTLAQLLSGLYLAVLSGLSIVLLHRLIKLFHLFRTSARMNCFSDFSVIESDQQSGSFSFFQYVFIGNASQFSQEDKSKIILHERAHIQLWHSPDILLIEIIKLFFWFNPAVYLLKRNLKDIHEYQADSLACAEGDRDSYCILMARMALLSVNFPIANYFNQSQTLKRITMINGLKKSLSKAKSVSILSISLVFFIIIACQDQLKNQPGGNEIPSSKTEVSASDEVLTVTDQPASPLAGIDEFYSDLGSHLRYPEGARKMGIEGKVFVEFTVNKDGSLTDIHVIKGISEECNSEAVRAISLSEKWNPGKHEGKIVRQKLVLPITFKLG